MNFTITGLSIDGHSVSVPNGLSELLNTARAWGNTKKELLILDQYDQKTERRNGNLVTTLTPKGR